MDDAELIAALRRLGPIGRLPDQSLFSGAAIEAAGLDLAEVIRFAQAHGGGELAAGAVKLRKGQRPQEGRVGRPEAFVAVPDAALD